MKKIKIYTGETITNKCGKELHPLKQVKLANDILLNDKDLKIAKIVNDNETLLNKSELVRNILLDFVKTEERYCGGGDGDIILFFKGSENINPREFLTKVSNRIIFELNKNKTNEIKNLR